MSILEYKTSVHAQSKIQHPKSKIVLVATLLIASLASCRRAEKAAVAPAPTPVPTPAFALPFAEKSEAMGVAFTHFNGAEGKKWMPETMGGGVAVLDYDGDGKPDLLFVSGASLSPVTKWTKSSLALYRNEGVGPDGLPHFRDVTREAGLAVSFYGMGAAVGDYDNDGRDDVLVTALDHARRRYHGKVGTVDKVGRRTVTLGVKLGNKTKTLITRLDHIKPFGV